MKLIKATRRREFRGWSGARFEITRHQDGLIELAIVNYEGSTAVEVSQEETQQIVEVIKKITSLQSRGDYDKKTKTSLKIGNDEGVSLTVRYTNDGEPFREGIQISIAVEGQWDLGDSIELDDSEADEVAQYLEETE